MTHSTTNYNTKSNSLQQSQVINKSRAETVGWEKWENNNTTNG